METRTETTAPSMKPQELLEFISDVNAAIALLSEKIETYDVIGEALAHTTNTLRDNGVATISFMFEGQPKRAFFAIKSPNNVTDFFVGVCDILADEPAISDVDELVSFYMDNDERTTSIEHAEGAVPHVSGVVPLALAAWVTARLKRTVH